MPALTTKSAKAWPDAETAHREFSKLPDAKDNTQAVALLKNDYGIPEDAIPADWRVADHRGKSGIVYPGIDAHVATVAYKWKSIDRDEHDKRANRFLFGQGGALISPGTDPTTPVVIVSGEEKSIAAHVAGFQVLSPLSGEKALPSEWVESLCNHPHGLILANDHDAAGRAANAATAEALENAGFPPERMRVIAYPPGTPEKADLNVLLKQYGPDGLKQILESAPRYESKLPRVLNAAQFLAEPRPKLRYHIHGILPYNGKLTFSATSKFGKSLLAIQMGLALAAGHVEWLGWKFGEPALVLYLQAEIMDALVDPRLRTLLDQMPMAFDRDRAARNFHVQSVDKSRPNLISNDGRKRIEAILRRVRPRALILDPLAATCPGLEENAAESMGLALGYFSDLTVKFGCAVILIHHFGKSGFSRGSSVFEAWPESDLQASFVDEDRAVAKVDMKLRCAYNSGPVYWQTPSKDDLWFASMPEGWAPSNGKERKKKAELKHVEIVLKAEKEPMRWSDLTDQIMDLTDCSKRTAENVISEAKKAGKVDVENGKYSLPK